MTVRDGERFLDQTINNVRTQTLKDFEFIIVDDGSTDATPKILTTYARHDPRIVVLCQKRERLIAAHHCGITAARAPFLARIDSDDVATSERLAHQVERMEREPELGLLGGQAYTIDEQGRPLGLRTPPIKHKTLVALLARTNPFIHSTVMLRIDLVRALGGYRLAFELAEDYDL
jgi:glycosyltransferase involved in cell wall biosynthesis